MSLCVLKKLALRSPSGHRKIAYLISGRQLLKIVGPRAPGKTNTWSLPPERFQWGCCGAGEEHRSTGGDSVRDPRRTQRQRRRGRSCCGKRSLGEEEEEEEDGRGSARLS